LVVRIRCAHLKFCSTSGHPGFGKDEDGHQAKNSPDASDALATSGCAGATSVGSGACGLARDAGAELGSSAVTACRDVCFGCLGLRPIFFSDDSLIGMLSNGWNRAEPFEHPKITLWHRQPSVQDCMLGPAKLLVN
jgi:hypothetical protein